MNNLTTKLLYAKPVSFVTMILRKQRITFFHRVNEYPCLLVSGYEVLVVRYDTPKELQNKIKTKSKHLNTNYS